MADAKDAYRLRHGGDGEIRVHPIPPRLHMLSATELDDIADPRIGNHLQPFRAARIPEPEQGHWQEWKDLLSSRAYPVEAGPTAAMNLKDFPNNIEIVSGTLIGVPAYPGFASLPRWLYAAGPPNRFPFEPVDLNG